MLQSSAITREWIMMRHFVNRKFPAILVLAWIGAAVVREILRVVYDGANPRAAQLLHVARLVS